MFKKRKLKYPDGGTIRSNIEPPFLPEPIVKNIVEEEIPFPYNKPGIEKEYNFERAKELYEPDEKGHLPSVDYTNGMWLKSKKYPTAWMELLHGYALNPEVQKQYQHPVINPEGYFGENQLQYMLKTEYKYGGNMKKRKLKKYATGGLYDDAQGSQAVYGIAGAATGVPGAGVIMQAGDKANDGVAKLGNRFFQNKYDYTDEEMAIYNEGSQMLGNIPFMGAALGTNLDLLNKASGRTDKKINKFREQNRIANVERINTNNDFSGYVDQAQVTFANGGDLSMLEGPSHAEGGIQLTPEAEVEGGETKKANYIFSDRLIIPGKKTTFAQQSKKINKMYLGKRPNDPISKQAEERELAVLQDMQEIVRGEIMSNAYTKAYGGFLKKKKMYAGGNMPNDPLTKYEDLYDQRMNKLMKFTPDTSDLGRDIIEPIENISSKPYIYSNTNYPENEIPLQNNSLGNLGNINNPSLSPMQKYLADNYPSSLNKLNYNADDDLGTTFTPETIPDLTNSNSEPDNAFGMQPADYASIAAGAAAGVSQLYYGLKGPDEVPDAKFRTARPNKINMTKAKRLASQEIDSSFNLTDDAIRTAAPTVASYLSNRLASGIKRARTKAETNINLSQREEIENNNTQNNFNQFNAQVLNAEEQVNLGQADKRIQEKDAARMAVTEGLNNIGQSVGQGVRDKRAYDWQENLAGNWMGTNNFVMDEQGNRYFLNSEGKYIKMIKKKK